MILFLVSIAKLLNSYESSINLFRVYPYSDLASVGGVSSVSLIDRRTGFYSPSFLSHLDGSSFAGSFWNDYSGKGYFSFFSFSYDIDEKTGANFTYYGYNSGIEDVYNMNGSFENVVFEKNYIISASYGFSLYEKISLGFKSKYISSTLFEHYNSSTYAFDGDFFLDFFPYSLKLGVENIGGSMKYLVENEKLPLFISFEVSRFFLFNGFKLSSGVNFKKSQDYLMYSIAGEVLTKRIPIKLSFAYQKEELSRFFVGLGLFFENVYISSSFSFPKVFQSNDLRFSFTYFFKSQDLDYYNNEKKKDVKRKRESQPKDKEKSIKKDNKKQKDIDFIIF